MLIKCCVEMLIRDFRYDFDIGVGSDGALLLLPLLAKIWIFFGFWPLDLIYVSRDVVATCLPLDYDHKL